MIFNDLIYQWLSAMAISSARIMPIFIMLPFLNSSVINNTIRLPVAILIGLSLWPGFNPVEEKFQVIEYVIILLKESFIGLFLSCLINIPFWVLHAAGCIIDNQRGATISSSIDPLSGVDTSELANFFNLFCAVIFIYNGGIILTLDVINKSYQIFKPFSMALPNLTVIFDLITYSITKSIMIASPLIAICLFTEAILGLLSRFAPQMNVFSLALTVKSFISFMILIFYLSSSIQGDVSRLSFTSEKLMSLEKIRNGSQ